VLPSHIDTHFTEKPHKLSKKEQQRVADKARTINGLISNKEILRRSSFAFPLPTA